MVICHISPKIVTNVAQVAGDELPATDAAQVGGDVLETVVFGNLILYASANKTRSVFAISALQYVDAEQVKTDGLPVVNAARTEIDALPIADVALIENDGLAIADAVQIKTDVLPIAGVVQIETGALQYTYVAHAGNFKLDQILILKEFKVISS